MPQLTESAKPTKIKSINESLVGCKLRVAGRMLSYNVLTDTMLLADREDGVLVNVRLCTENNGEWGRERKGIVMAVGYLERVDIPLPVPPTLSVDPHLILDALLVTDAGDLDLGLWNYAVECL